MAKATHSGTCQICGNFQKLPKGRLSNHGYTVQWGFFSGTCQGAYGKPFEESTDLIEAVVEDCKKKVLIIKELIKTIKEATGTSATAHHYTRGTYGCTGGYSWKKVELISAPIRKDSKYISHKMYKVEGDEKMHEADTNMEYPKSPEEAAKVVNEIYINHKLLKDIADLERYIAWQEERIANWKPGKLVPVKD